MALSMRRIVMLVTVVALMAAMVVVAALPAMAAPGNGANHFSTDAGSAFGKFDIKAVFTPSGVSNATAHSNPEGGNAGGTGDGGAEVFDDRFFIDVDAGTLSDPEAHFVNTPSGNTNVQGHSKI